MTDWNAAAGLADVPDWRSALRYRVAASYYRGGKALDVGCGDGRLCWKYGICAPEDYTGVEVSAGLLRELTARTEGRARAVQGVAEHTGLPDRTFDFVVCTECFEHLPDPGLALQEFNRVLKPGGRIVIQSPNAMRLRNINPIHIAALFIGYWIPAVLLRKVLHPNTHVDAYTYHWDFTRQDIDAYIGACPGLRIECLHGRTYRFNPEGGFLHRMLATVFRLPVVHWVGWDLTVVLVKQP